MTPLSDSTADGLQVLGICRFSVPSEGAFQVEHDTIAERRAFLYDPARLDYRFAWFEHMLLPSIAAQRDKAFRLVIMLGEDFPEPWRARMEAHIAAHPQLVAAYVPPGHHRRMVGALMAEHSDPEACAVAQFRLDDDDAVAIDFTRSLREDFLKLRAYFEDHGWLAIDYGRGLIVEHQGVEKLAVRAGITHFWSAGMAVYSRPGDGHHILEVPHNGTWQRMAAVTDVEQFMFIRGEHDSNDSKIKLMFHKLDIERADLMSILRRRFQVDPVRLRRALGAARAAHPAPAP